MKVVPYTLQHNTNQSKDSNKLFDYKNTICLSLKYLKMYSIGGFFLLVFCKVMLQHVFNNHNNINMNDIQNSNNNYSHRITLAFSILATLPCVWPFFLAV